MCRRRGPSDGHEQVHGKSQGALRRQRQGQGRRRTLGRHPEHRLRRRLQGSRDVRQETLNDRQRAVTAASTHRAKSLHASNGK